MEHTRRKNIISTIITLVILFIGFMGFQMLSGMKKSTVMPNFAKKERRMVQVGSFPTTQEENLIEIDGRLQAHERVNISSKVTGVMEENRKSVKVGKYFKKGEILFKVDDREAALNLKAQKSNLMTSITQMMPDFKFDYPEAFVKWEKYLNNFDVNRSIDPLPEPSSTQEKFFVSGKSLHNQYYAIKSAETRLQDYVINAPFSGVITAVNIFPGALIGQGTVLASMINTSYYEIEAPVPLENLKSIRTGQLVKLTSRELDQEWTGKVNRIGTQIDPNTQNLPVFITVTGKGLKDGMYLNGTLKGKPLEGVVKVPKNLFISPTSLYIVEDSTLVAKTIEPIKREEDYIIIKGLEESDKVVISSLSGLFEGQKVNY